MKDRHIRCDYVVCMNKDCDLFRRPMLQAGSSCSSCGGWAKAARRADFSDDDWEKAKRAPGMQAQIAMFRVGGR